MNEKSNTFFEFFCFAGICVCIKAADTYLLSAFQLFHYSVQGKTVLFRNVAGIALAVRRFADDLKAALALCHLGYHVVYGNAAALSALRVNSVNGGGKIVQMGGEDTAQTRHAEALQHL